MQRGRKSSSSNVIQIHRTSPRSIITVPSSLDKSERALFNEIVSTHGHLAAGDAPLIVAFVEARLKAAKLAKGKDVQSWERASRMALAIARSLRITPQAKVHPEAAGRKQPHGQVSYYDTPHDDD